MIAGFLTHATRSEIPGSERQRQGQGGGKGEGEGEGGRERERERIRGTDKCTI